MKRNISTIICILLSILLAAQQEPNVYVDKNGCMRWSDTHLEASFFGVNYTMPFAHAFRAANYLGVDHKAAIDRDVYHFARLGFTAYRIHLWDVELSDAQGNLLNNEHLNLLDYLISKLKERNIRVLITAQTNFGNGYPEQNQHTGGFSYNFDKCDVHSNAQAIAAQQKYITALVQHVNSYTAKAYKDEPAIVGFEINNEPCHSGSQQQTRDYINQMLEALKKAGNRKPVFYNVSHNMQQEEAYFSTAIEGTTYQWYPTGLVAGHTRKGNFLPSVDKYNIPFAKVRGFEQKAKAIYEFDPADLLYSYMYPAMVRTFKSAGFQWITQFAYDPLDLALYNTEYQTHFLNLAYTPRKAISMKIAAQAAITLPLNKSYGAYPMDTLFGDFHVSYLEDLSELNSAKKFYYSNNTTTLPRDPQLLQSIAGCGHSPVVGYEGTGAYFIDRLEKGIWRLEIMPDAVPVSDPFAKPSLKKEVARIFWGRWDMSLDVPDLGKSFSIRGINNGNTYNQETSDGIIRTLAPGVYLLEQKGLVPLHKWQGTTRWENIRLDEFVAPLPQKDSLSYTLTLEPVKVTDKKPLVIETMVAGTERPDSVIIYTDRISFWKGKNTYKKMEHVSGYTYRAVIPVNEIKEGIFRYNVVVCSHGSKQTFPSGVLGSPLDWDYTNSRYFETRVVDNENPVILFSVTDEQSDLETFTMPEASFTGRSIRENFPTQKNTLLLNFKSEAEHPKFFMRKYIKEEVKGRKERLKTGTTLCLHVKKAPDGLQAGFITTDGFTYRATCPKAVDEIIRIPVSALRQTETALLPNAYPVFLDKYFSPSISITLMLENIESIELSFEGEKNKAQEMEIGSIWIE